MKNLILEELHRIHEIMGISTTKLLLTEGVGDEIISYLTKNADDFVAGGVKQIDNFRKFGGFSKMTDEQLTALLDKYIKSPTKELVIAEIIKKMDGAAIKKIANDFWVKSTSSQKSVQSVMDKVSTDYSRGVYDNIDDALDDFEESFRIGLGEPPLGFSKIYDEIINARADALKGKLEDIVNPSAGKTTNSTENATTETKYLDMDVETAKAQMQMAYNQAYSKGKVPKSADGTPMPRNPGDEFFEFYQKKMSGLSERKLEKIRKDLIEQFGSDPKKLSDKLKVFTKTLGYGPGIVKLLVEMILSPLGSLLTFWKKHWIALSSIILVSGIGYIGSNTWKEYQSGGMTVGAPLFCWQKNIITFNDLDLSVQKKIIESSGIGCDDFDSGDDSKIPKSVTEKLSPNTNKTSYEIKFNDGHIDVYDDNFNKKGGTIPPNTEQYTNDESGFLDWAKKNNYTNPDYNGYWYTDNGTDKQASYSNGTWQ
jgi:hypothetical protein